MINFGLLSSSGEGDLGVNERQEQQFLAGPPLTLSSPPSKYHLSESVERWIHDDITIDLAKSSSLKNEAEIQVAPEGQVAPESKSTALPTDLYNPDQILKSIEEMPIELFQTEPTTATAPSQMSDSFGLSLSNGGSGSQKVGYLPRFEQVRTEPPAEQVSAFIEAPNPAPLAPVNSKSQKLVKKISKSKFTPISEQKQKRLDSNKQSAKDSRERKKQYRAYLEDSIQDIRRELPAEYQNNISRSKIVNIPSISADELMEHGMEKDVARLEANRLAAQSYRDKIKNYIRDLEQELKALEIAKLKHSHDVTSGSRLKIV